jgi:general secretion pathway protein M
LLAWAIVLLALGGFYLLIVAPLLDLYSDREATLADRRMLAPRLSAAAAELPALRARVTELRAAASTSRIALDGASEAIASANLQSRIKELAESAGATVGSTEALAAENRGDYRRIGLRIAVGGEYDTLVKLLTTIETGTPPLVLNNLQIHGTAQPTGQPSSARLDATFEVYGFRSTDASPPLQQ